MKNLIGQQVSRNITAEKWITELPSLDGKFILVDFWVTTCFPCLTSIRKLNEIHDRFLQNLVVIGLSEETQERIVQAKKVFNIRYSLGVDSEGRFEKHFEVRAHPQSVIIDPKGIVRWQGNPIHKEYPLTPKVIEKIINDYFSSLRIIDHQASSLRIDPKSYRFYPKGFQLDLLYVSFDPNGYGSSPIDYPCRGKAPH